MGHPSRTRANVTQDLAFKLIQELVPVINGLSSLALTLGISP